MKNLDELKQYIASSYGSEDKIFAGHPFDTERARLALQEVFKLALGFNEYISLHREFLISKGVSEDHIKKQLKNVRDVERYFLED